MRSCPIAIRELVGWLSVRRCRLPEDVKYNFHSYLDLPFPDTWTLFRAATQKAKPSKSRDLSVADSEAVLSQRQRGGVSSLMSRPCFWCWLVLCNKHTCNEMEKSSLVGHFPVILGSRVLWTEFARAAARPFV